MKIGSLFSTTVAALVVSAACSTVPTEEAREEKPPEEASVRPSADNDTGGPRPTPTGPTLEDVQSVPVEDWMIFVPPDMDAMRGPLENLTRWQIAVDASCASTDNVSYGPASKLFFISCQHPSGDARRAKNVFFSKEQVLEISRLIEGGEMPLKESFVPQRP